MMALPLPKVVADVGPGGGIVTAMGGMNSLANDMLLRQMNQIKKQYLPTTMQAEAASKLAYANLMGPQFLAKLLGNPGAIANMGDDAAKAALQKAVGAGMGQGSAMNSFNQMQGGHPSGIGQPGTNSLSGWFANKLKEAFHRSPEQTSNPFAQGTSIPGQYNGDSQYSSPPAPRNEMSSSRPPDGVMKEGEQWYNSKGEPVYADDDQESGQNPMQMELTEGRREPTWAEKTGRHQGTIKQGEEAGKYRAQAQKDIGQSQLALSNSGSSLHRMASIIKNPVIQEMRSKIPFFQDKQLGYLEKMGTPEQKKLIGDFITTGEQIIASGVQAFGGKPLVREFDLLQRQKINRNDPIHVAEGKLQASIALHDIAEKKNEIINDLLDRGVNEADAVRQANKMVDVSAIEKQTQDLLRDKPTEEDINYMAKKRGISPNEVKKLLKAKGLY
jgi:hypothetical protein